LLLRNFKPTGTNGPFAIRPPAAAWGAYLQKKFYAAVSRKPSESDLSRLAENELKALQCFSVPTFVNPHTGQLTISGINTQGSLWNKERQTSFNQTANSISKSVYYLGDKAAGLEVAAVFAVVNYTIAWFSKPKAKDVFRAWALPRNASPLLTRIDPPRSCSPEVTHPFSAREN